MRPIDPRFELVQAAQHFLLKALPLRHAVSRSALREFFEAVRLRHLSRADVEVVVVRLLEVLNVHACGRLPSLVDRYLSLSGGRVGDLAALEECFEDLLRYRGIGDSDVENAIAVLERRSEDPHVTPAAVADEVLVPLDELSMRFRRVTGHTMSEYLRSLRLDRSAHLLASTTCRVKEVWAAVGYNHAANFDHDFKKRFGITPSEYRQRASDSAYYLPQEPANGSRPTRTHSRVLIVDDDQIFCHTAKHFLSGAGYDVDIATSGRDALISIADTDIDAVVLDYRLPDVSGLDVLRSLRNVPLASRAPVALFTADWSADEDADEIRSLGAMLASKICDLNEFERLVASLVASSRLS